MPKAAIGRGRARAAREPSSERTRAGSISRLAKWSRSAWRKASRVDWRSVVGGVGQIIRHSIDATRSCLRRRGALNKLRRPAADTHAHRHAVPRTTSEIVESSAWSEVWRVSSVRHRACAASRYGPKPHGVRDGLGPEVAVSQAAQQLWNHVCACRRSRSCPSGPVTVVVDGSVGLHGFGVMSFQSEACLLRPRQPLRRRVIALSFRHLHELVSHHSDTAP